MLKYNIVFEKMVEKPCPGLKEKKTLWEELLGAVACEPEHDSLVILVLSLFETRDVFL